MEATAAINITTLSAIGALFMALAAFTGGLLYRLGRLEDRVTNLGRQFDQQLQQYGQLTQRFDQLIDLVISENAATREEFRREQRGMREEFRQELRETREEFRREQQETREEFRREQQETREEFRREQHEMREGKPPQPSAVVAGFGASHSRPRYRIRHFPYPAGDGQSGGIANPPFSSQH